MKKVTIYSTVGKKATILEDVQATNWSELKTLMRAKEVQYNGMKAVVGETRNTLESDKASLPEADFSLFLMPVKTKSGAGERKELMQQYKNSAKAKEHFHNKGLQITRMKTDEIKRELANVGLEVIKPKEAVVGKAPDSKTLGKKSGKTDTAISKEYVDTIVEKLDDINDEIENGMDNSDIESEVGEVLQEKIGSLIKIVEAGDEGIREALEEEKRKSEAIKKLEEEMSKEAHDLANEFSDVRNF